MEEQIVEYTTAVLAKEKGFNEYCRVKFKNHDNTPTIIGIPSQPLLQKWLRETHKIYIEIQIEDGVVIPRWHWKIFTHREQGKGLIWINKDSNGIYWSKYEECLENCLLESLNLIKNEA
jgi:hypothetical protein